jgi:dipeptidase D
MNILDLEPKGIWKNFNELNAIPRPSKKESKVIAFIKDFGESLDLGTTVDETGNVLIRKPASTGMESRKKVILQAHLDMVCQKNSDTKFNFETDGIKTLIDGDWVTADGTTLGADNGIGVATIMGILESDDIVHPELEALFTIDEETGMSGAFGLKPGFLSGDILLNLDTEDDDEITIGCAGGMDVTASQRYTTEVFSGKGISIEIKGLRGGHSGVDIQEGRGNANVLLTRFLWAGLDDGIRLGSIEGGGLRNAIPREAKAWVTVSDIDTYSKSLDLLKSDILKEYHSIEKDLKITIATIYVNEPVMSVGDSKLLIQGLMAAHNGVFRMSPEVEGLVEASNNIARVHLQEGHVLVQCLTRSSVESTKMTVGYQLQSSFELGGMNVLFEGSYPGWKPNPDADILTIMERIYQQKFNSKPRIDVIHAGLECGIIGAHYPKMEMVSFGPTIKGAHSPEEKVSISSVQKFWGYLLDILKEIPEKG